ncbi:hypothetical protein [Roseospira goensis]|uniref:Uncharacterized protein n=1 Tax=Roseospira goensis TaxID=391922 RepID=A0A7W6S3B1_9PROT|nr:hypothetical protein [Roseospira goensis]MBB4287605.1 hypothetical protein [Roseospira goensis]
MSDQPPPGLVTLTWEALAGAAGVAVAALGVGWAALEARLGGIRQSVADTRRAADDGIDRLRTEMTQGRVTDRTEVHAETTRLWSTLDQLRADVSALSVQVARLPTRDDLREAQDEIVAAVDRRTLPPHHGD